MTVYARADRARGLCDRCGFNVLLSSLRVEVVDGRKTGLKVCDACWDPDHPIYQRGKINFFDPMSLRDPRPDHDRVTTTSYFGWDPIGNPINKLTILQGDIIAVVVED